ncbi:predicted protein [Naegleria gruberi]|uniref:Predicted protein n=1 Tax=Naegleria gruberi TaxID=5762 RepID=D2V1H5_NAEGR|nr:uncharacterized protein NAEGRDRAFT_62582 [Naegleria gruberi]EFC49166.1 predicted protein [Naegleria gruberi]|eukprot:XP_002681910.1 predicted protein [Naegleria gruberi strain NEG-M]
MIKPINIALYCFLAILLMVINHSLALITPRVTLPRMVSTKQGEESCCLPRKISLQGSIFQVSYEGNMTNTFFGTWILNNDLDNGKARSDLVSSNSGPNVTTVSYRNGQNTFTYTYIPGQTCYCVKIINADWNRNYCTSSGRLLEQSNVGFNKANKYGFENVVAGNKYIDASYYWTIPVDQKTCIFVSNVEAIAQSIGTFSKNTQFYGASYQVDPKLFVIPQYCPPESQCPL